MIKIGGGSERNKSFRGLYKRYRYTPQNISRFRLKTVTTLTTLHCKKIFLKKLAL